MISIPLLPSELNNEIARYLHGEKLRRLQCVLMYIAKIRSSFFNNETNKILAEAGLKSHIVERCVYFNYDDYIINDETEDKITKIPKLIKYYNGYISAAVFCWHLQTLLTNPIYLNKWIAVDNDGNIVAGTSIHRQNVLEDVRKNCQIGFVNHEYLIKW